MLHVGDPAPDFELPDQDARPVRLTACLARGPVLLYFYPADFTPVCTREACGYRDLQPQLEHRGAAVIGISPQDSASHARFRQRHALPFPLLSDADKRVIRAYGCDGPLGFGVRRVSYLIGTNGRIQARVHAAFRVSRHLELAGELPEKR
ncbi:MAG: peroxiredoxin [Gammaproteobacteria bacterium]|nr:peroxiredoxin [Gammaproteobacteria bacterium]MDE2024682.1 peroxiredoxin [Gammaproteobacteria bacterium]MDE2140695.1 peroxiredoxin [Gammaproteobacteria bacterium]